MTMQYTKNNPLRVVTLCSDEWNPIVGYEGIYEVSIGGLVRSLLNGKGKLKTIYGRKLKFI